MYSTITDINREIAALEEERDYQILYWFEMGENDRTANLPPQYPNNEWYAMGYGDRDYQIEIGFDLQLVIFDHF